MEMRPCFVDLSALTDWLYFVPERSRSGPYVAETGLIPLGIYMTGSRPLVDNSFFSMVKLHLTVCDTT